MADENEVVGFDAARSMRLIKKQREEIKGLGKRLKEMEKDLNNGHRINEVYRLQIEQLEAEILIYKLHSPLEDSVLDNETKALFMAYKKQLEAAENRETLDDSWKE